MDVRMRIAVTSEEVNVAEFCRQYGISRQTFYFWRRRYLAGGPNALQPLSRQPRSNPRRVGLEVEEAIVELRKQLAESGFDAGAGTIQWHLGRQGRLEVPSEARSGGSWFAVGS